MSLYKPAGELQTSQHNIYNFGQVRSVVFTAHDGVHHFHPPQVSNLSSSGECWPPHHRVWTYLNGVARDIFEFFVNNQQHKNSTSDNVYFINHNHPYIYDKMMLSILINNLLDLLKSYTHTHTHTQTDTHTHTHVVTIKCTLHHMKCLILTL